MERKTSGKPYGVTYIVLLCVAFGLLGAALACLAVANHNKKDQAVEAEKAFLDSLHVFPHVLCL